MLPKEFKSLWIASSSQTNYPELTKDLEVDVAIVGGGIAGMTAAYFLSEENFKVAVIEAERIAYSTSGNTTAKITSLHDLKYAYLKKNFGLLNAKIYSESNEWAIREISRLILKEKIECDFYKSPSYVYARTAEGKNLIEEEFSVAQELGLPVSFVTEISSIPFKIEGAIRFDNQAYFHPRKFILKLADMIIKKNNYIFENSEVIKIKEGKSHEVITSQAKLRAAKVVIATNFPIYDKGLYFARMQQKRSYSLAARLKSGLPDGMYIGVGDFNLSIRPHRNHLGEWLILGGEEHPTGETINLDHLKELEKKLIKFFDVEAIDYKWAAQDSFPFDSIPYIGRMPFSKDIYLTTGFGSWGMTTSVVSAKILTDLISDKKNDWLNLYSPSRFKLPLYLKQSKEMFLHLEQGFKNYFIKRENDLMPEPEEGKIISVKGRQIAVYKDKMGKIYTLSAVCTHMGCIIHWNNEEKSWDCACHGSRFSSSGEVLNGPAKKPLKKVKLF